MTIKVEFHEKD